MPKPFFPNIDKLNQIIRVDHAGEKAASIIYKNQIDSSLKNKLPTKITDLLNEMYIQELRHLKYFEEQLSKSIPLILKPTLPTLLMPIWQVLSIGLARFSVLCGSRYVMITTEAIEDAIDGHYSSQQEFLEKMEDMVLTYQAIYKGENTFGSEWVALNSEVSQKIYLSLCDIKDTIARFRLDELEHLSNASEYLEVNFDSDKIVDEASLEAANKRLASYEGFEKLFFHFVNISCKYAIVISQRI